MAYLLAKDTVTGAEGSVVVTKEGRNYVVAGMRNITTNAEIQSSDMRVIGTHHRDNPGQAYYGTNLWTDGYRLRHQPVDGHGAPVHPDRRHAGV